MSNNSSTGGFISPAASPAPLEDQELNRFLQQIVVGITGLTDTSVRPRWQPEPPNLPDQSTNWAAIGVTNTTPDTFGVELHNPTGNGDDQFQRHEIITILTSFYGPNANYYCALLRDGLQIAQNREILQVNGMGLVETGSITTVPSLVKDRWLYRIDMPMIIKRGIFRSYPVLNILSSEIELDTEAVQVDINVQP